MANANLFQQYLQPARSVIDYQNDYAKADALKNQNAMQALSLQQAANVQQQRNALRDLVQSGQIDLNDSAGSARALTLAPDVAPGLMKTIQEGKTSAAMAAKDTAQAGNFTADAAKTTQGVQQNNYTQAMQKVLSFQTPADAAASLNSAVSSGKIDMQHATMMARSIPQNDPAAFDAWKRQWAVGIADPAKMAELMAPHINTMNTGGAQVTQAVDPITLKPTTLSSTQNTQSPDNAATQAGENARAAASRATQLQVAGMGPGGSISPALEAEAKLIAAGKAAPPSGFAATRPAAAMLMQRVSEINPEYDATTYGAKVKAAKDFTSGTQGNQMRSFQVANDHLDQLLTMSQALNNGNYQLVNKIGNAFGVQSGQAPAAVFNAVRNLVGPEITSAIVAGGGSAHERDSAAATFSPDSSPEQFAQTVGATRNLMQAKYSAMLEQRRQAGLPDSTLPAYGGAAGGNVSGFKITHIDGKPQ